MSTRPCPTCHGTGTTRAPKPGIAYVDKNVEGEVFKVFEALAPADAIADELKKHFSVGSPRPIRRQQPFTGFEVFDGFIPGEHFVDTVSFNVLPGVTLLHGIWRPKKEATA